MLANQGVESGKALEIFWRKKTNFNLVELRNGVEAKFWQQVKDLYKLELNLGVGARSCFAFKFCCNLAKAKIFSLAKSR